MPAFAAAILYGTTYQQFRFFTLDDPGGAADAVHYVGMAQGDRPVDAELRHYRWLTPTLVRIIQPVTLAITGEEMLGIRLGFYMVNFLFSLGAMLALFQLLRVLRFSVPLSLLGLCAYAASRVTVLVTGTPMVDAAYFCSIAFITWLTIANKPVVLALLMPIMVVTKLTILPFLALPLLTGLRRQPAIWLGLGAAAATLVGGRALVEAYWLDGRHPSELAAITEHLVAAGRTVTEALTWRGLRDIHSAFSVLWLFAVAGAWMNRRPPRLEIPFCLQATLPLATVLGVLSGNWGRMLFAAFPVIIPLALLPLRAATRDDEGALPVPSHRIPAR